MPRLKILSAWSLEQKKLKEHMLDLQLPIPYEFCDCKEKKVAKLKFIPNALPQK